jgi:hypothetical protein
MLLTTGLLAPIACAEEGSHFDTLKMLVGEWRGTLPDGNPIDISYRQISGGAIIEEYHSTDPMWWNMSSVYHPDTDKIIMSHYCSWGNHPRMTAEYSKIQDNKIAFQYLDIARTQPDNGYMHNATIHIQDQDHFTHQWIWRENGNDTPLTLHLQRKQVSN